MLLPDLIEELELTDAGCGYPIDFANELVDELLAIDVFEDAAREDELADSANTALDLREFESAEEASAATRPENGALKLAELRSPWDRGRDDCDVESRPLLVIDSS